MLEEALIQNNGNNHNKNTDIVKDLLNVNASSDNKSNYVDIKKIQNTNSTSDKLHFEKIDKMYEKLYAAINSNDLKKITHTRGRLIRTLKRHKREIKKLYKEIEPLEKINYLLSKDASMDEIRSILIKKENINYFVELQDYLSNKESFKKKFDNLYRTKEVKRIMMYYNALNEELECQKRDYKQRYSEEFLHNKGDIKTTLASFPKAMALSAKSIANSVNEIKEARSNRKRVLDSMETLKQMGKLTVTPIVFTGKFITSIWYTVMGKIGFNPKESEKKEQKRSSLDSLFLYDESEKLSTNSYHK